MSYPYFGNYPYYPQNVPQQIQQQIPQQMPQQINPPQQTGIIWINDENIVKNYSVAPGGSVLFMHEMEPYMYMKSADQIGKTTIKKLRLIDESEHAENKEELKEYIKREELEDLISEKIQKEIEKKISELSFKPTKTKKNEED